MTLTSISYASGPAEKALLGDPIGQFFDKISTRYAEREAIVSLHQNTRLTYLQLAGRVNALAKAFISTGFKKGDRLGVWSPNNIEWLITQYATAKAGIILVTINPAYRSHELAFVLKQSGCKGLVLQNQFKTSDYEGIICELCADLIGSLKMNQFIDENPERFFQIGIAEANMMGIAAGLTIGGKIPFTGTFANFSTGRVYDQIRQSIAYSNKNVKICASHAGLTLGEDGATHQILEDIGLMKMLPS